MKISVIGTGYVGLVTGVCLANLGNDVVCVDVDQNKIKKLSEGIPTIYEPGLEELLIKNIKEKRISFTDSFKSIQKANVIFIAVGTPQGENGEADMSAVFSVAKNIGKYINGYKIVINKSTVPVGSGDRVTEIISKNLSKKFNFDVISNPEFLREGSAISDFMHPDRIVIGSDNHAPAKIIKQLYQVLNAPILITDVKSAEIIKYASNAFLATKISFINEIANICEIVGANVADVAKGMGMDNRIGPQFLNAGIGYGGSCFPKDTIALVSTAQKYGYQFKTVQSTIEVNNTQRSKFFQSIKKFYNHKLSHKKFAIWGASFKPNTDDMRDAPSINIIQSLLKEKAIIQIYDPVALDEARKIFADRIQYFENEYEALKDCDALIILTEWNEFRQVNMEKVKKMLTNPVIFDGRNIYDPQYMKEMKFSYISIGRKPVK
ncbi:MAG: UDP-glucose/GDP-mannose dehydrogenase family protein [Spirochaetes bacterium]|nr:UDP-glucose/GDP-mannose dehydrogenase family protein [Spirochaetota bacterium]